VTPDQRARLDRLADEARDLADSLQISRDAPADAADRDRAQFRYPLRYVEFAITQLERAVAYDERRVA
jgi:hypothetical protein